MNWNLSQLLLETSPMFWFMVGSFFLGIGVLWANVCWANYRVRLMDAEAEQLFLIAEREQAFEARERRNREANVPKSQTATTILRFDKSEELHDSSPQTNSERTSS